MNSVIQCFCHIEKFVNYFKYNKNIKETINKYKKENKSCLTNSFKIIIENLWPNDNKYINYEFFHKNKYNNYFAPYKPYEYIHRIKNNFENPQDLVNFIIMNLHYELNKKKKEKNFSDNNFMPEQSDKEAMFNYFIQNFMRECSSFISDNFFGTILNQFECLNCKSKKYNYNIYSYLIFPVEDVVKFKENKLMLNNINSITIEDCFEFNQRNQTLSGENAIPCNKCNFIYASNNTTFIFTAPEILILIFEKSQMFNIKLEVNLEINLYNNIITRETGFKFKLIGVVSKYRKFDMSEYFIAYCKSPIDNCWYKYNNDFVSRIDNFQGYLINPGIPYILFYEKTN